MHSYRKAGDGWQVGYHCPASGTWDGLGPTFGVECEAAAYACFLNGGRYCPDEIEALFRKEPAQDDVTGHSTKPHGTYPRPQGMDYEPEAARK